MTGDLRELKQRLLKLIDDVTSKDTELREELQIGEKFRFIRDRVGALKSHVDESLQAIKDDDQDEKRELGADEQVVYVYLFNAHGIDVQTWHKMLRSSVYYEYSVNRPIYEEKGHIEASIRSKTDRNQHAYLAIAVKKSDIISQGGTYKDNLGHPLLKIKEGSLHPERLQHFVHNENLYEVNEDGSLEKLE